MTPIYIHLNKLLRKRKHRVREDICGTAGDICGTAGDVCGTAGTSMGKQGISSMRQQGTLSMGQQGTSSVDSRGRLCHSRGPRSTVAKPSAGWLQGKSTCQESLMTWVQSPRILCGRGELISKSRPLTATPVLCMACSSSISSGSQTQVLVVLRQAHY